MHVSASVRSIESTEGHLHLFGHDIAVHVLYDFIGFKPATSASVQPILTDAEGTIVIMASMDAFIATALTCSWDD